VSGLTGADRVVIDKARALAGLRTTEAVTERFSGWPDTGTAYAEAFGNARWLLAELADTAERLAGEEQAGEDTRRLGEIRALLAGFDWEYHDRQLALEAIDRIADGGRA
jgi:hypothetical protein